MAMFLNGKRASYILNVMRKLAITEYVKQKAIGDYAINMTRFKTSFAKKVMTIGKRLKAFYPKFIVFKKNVEK